LETSIHYSFLLVLAYSLAVAIWTVDKRKEEEGNK
jgi:hypothetical protein